MSPIVTYRALQSNDLDIGEHRPKPCATAMTEAVHRIWSRPRVETGLWECTPGTFSAARDGYVEICIILSGSVTIAGNCEPPVIYGLGDVVVMPSGWKGTWEAHKALRKHFTTNHV